LSLGEYGPDRFSLAERKNQLPRLLQLYRDDPDPGIHSATELLLRQWHGSDEMQAIDKQLGTGKVEGQRQWYLTLQGQMMVLVPKPGNFRRGGGESRIDRSFAIGSMEVTVEQFLRFRMGKSTTKKSLPLVTAR
jgi:eukaryotic-like serine/threonine-protein kinase